MRKHLPNTLTILNLTCGFISILLVLRGELVWAGYLIFMAGLFDFLDGFAARLLNAYSDMGKQLDSLADVVSFGVAPAFLFSALITHTFSLLPSREMSSILYDLIILSPVLLVLATALRLARFNLDTAQGSMFQGLPSPASGLFFASLVFIQDELLNIPILVFALVSLTFSILLVSRFPMLSIKVQRLNEPKALFILLYLLFSIMILVVFSLKYIVALIILYIFMAAVIPQIKKRP